MACLEEIVKKSNWTTLEVKVVNEYLSNLRFAAFCFIVYYRRSKEDFRDIGLCYTHGDGWGEVVGRALNFLLTLA